MNANYERLEVSPGATSDQIKVAYHAKLREFPAHTYPEEFKAVRAAYEGLRQGAIAQFEDLLTPRPLPASLDPEIVNRLRTRASRELAVNIEDLIRLTF